MSTWNWGQILGGIVIIGGVLVGASSQLADMGIPADVVKGIVAFAGLAVAICGGFLTKFQSTASQLKTVQGSADPNVQKSLVEHVVARSDTVPAARNALVQAVVSQGDDPAVQKALIQRVSAYEGVESIQANPKMSATLKAMVDDAALTKIKPFPQHPPPLKPPQPIKRG